MRNPRWKSLLLHLAIWAAVWMVLTTQLYLTVVPRGLGISLGEIAYSQFLRVALWVLFTPLVLAIHRRHPLSGPHRWRAFFLHLVLSVAAMFANYGLRLASDELTGDSERGSLDFLNYLILSFNGRNFVDIGIYWLIIGAKACWTLLQRQLELELAGSQLKGQLAEAELRALKQQLQPHFLFNSLNSVAMLVRDKQDERAIETLAMVSTLLRGLIDSTRQQEAALEGELDFVRRYLAIEQIRFGDRLQVDYEVDSSCLPCLVPSLLLQPLVENAIKHGISRRMGPGRILLRAHRADGRLVLEVTNDLSDQPPPADAGGSHIGLATTRNRLQRTYGANFSLECDFNPPGPARVRVTLPELSAPTPDRPAPRL